ncbi:MAG: phosphoribosylamine--glycine ligase [Cyclobacteriaceae bacterium]|nr:phosphoribosylamine--glycine ligase [Cyclobacteriaceae bacterium]
MKILILGSGGREHTLAWKIAQSDQCDKLFVAPGNAGTANIAVNIDLAVTDFDQLATFIEKESIDLVVVGPEDPLVLGFRDYIESTGKLSSVKIVGPGKEGARLEGSKDFSKQFMQKYNIPTAAFATFTREGINDAVEYLNKLTPPFVIKADGLAAGKGVLICEDLESAQKGIKEMLLDEKFGEAGKKVLIEQYLQGIELSVFVLADGKDYLILPEAKDYKRIGEGDTGLNTGGMGAVSPVPFADQEFMRKVEEKVVKPTIEGLRTENIDYKGFIFIGLMNMQGEPYVIEYNVRMGDPETQAVIPRVENDLVDLLWKAAAGNLKGTQLITTPETATTIVMVAGGYPGQYAKGQEISGLDSQTDSLVFHAGTKEQEGQVVTNGGRVLGITSLGKNIAEALKKSYITVDNISWQDCNYRKDIGQDLLNL